MEIAVVVQRYGLEITGGSELHARWIAEHLSKKHNVEVLSTCAFDYSTWKNHYQPGKDVTNGVPVYRFPNEFTRNTEFFNQYSEFVFSNPHTYLDGLRWMILQGPYCVKLLDHIKKVESRYDVFIFFTYLYYTTYFGMQLVPGKSLLVPTVHDEAAIELDIFRSFFHLPRGYLFNTIWEQDFIREKFHNHHIPGEITGVGINKPETTIPGEFRKKYDIAGDFLLYLGRIEEGKGCKDLITYFRKYRENNPDTEIKLVLAGKTYMDIEESEHVRLVGYLKEQDKFNAINDSTIIVVPSPLESLSILLLEAFCCEKPVLVNGECEVLKSHCLQSNGGLFYRNYTEFSKCLQRLLSKKELRTVLGKQGREYQERLYNWDRVMKIYDSMLAMF
jgi:glycosyltransferase involved in cell wall biosynthesis